MLETPPPHEPISAKPARVKNLWRRFAAWCARQWQTVRPSSQARRGAVWGTLAAALVAVLIEGRYVRTGFGFSFDLTAAAIAAAIVIPLTAVVLALLLTIFRKLPRMATGLMIGSCVVVMLVFSLSELGVTMAIVAGLAEGFLGAAIASFVTGRFARAALSKKTIIATLCLLAIATNVYIVWLFAHAGALDKLATWRPPADSMPAKLAAPNPSETGPYRVKTLFYGAGTDIRRPEYGPSVAIKTPTVDASRFFKDFKGWKRWARKEYWKFDFDKLPLNARVWYPDGPGPFPLALIVHGNHNMARFSDPGYAYLGELLASRGFILASIDENFLNSGLFNDPPKQQPVRGWVLLEHLKLWREWNQTPGNPFQGKVDLSRIALMGHSRGGEAAATAVLFNHLRYYPDDANIRFDYGFNIQSVVAIAPPDGQYKPAGNYRWIENVNYLTLQGGYDADVSSFMGSRQWDHVRFTEPSPKFKAEIWAYRANHGQFNTEWGRTDSPEPHSWFLNTEPLMPGDEQRRISKTYITAFLETTLHNRRDYLPLFQDWRVGRDWLPDTIYTNRFEDASYQTVASFDDDPDLTTTTLPGGRIAGDNLSIWREGRIPWRRGDRDYNGVFLGWNRAKDAALPEYTITLPDSAPARFQLSPASTVELSLTALDEDAPLPGKDNDKEKKKQPKPKTRPSPDFTIELVATDGARATAPVSQFAAIPPPVKEVFTKLSLTESQRYAKDTEPVFQTVRIPLSAFQTQPNFDPKKLRVLRLKFDRTPSSVICISAIGFGNSTPTALSTLK